MTQVAYGEGYGGNAPENYERYFVPAIGLPAATGLVVAAQLRPGERVLDVACGTGIVARLAAEQVTPGGQVTGLDVNPGMIAVARASAPPEASIEWHQAPAEHMPLEDGSFDVVLCGMGLQFFSDREAGLREMYRVLVPGGRAVLNLPGPIPPVFSVFEEALTRHVGPEAAGFASLVFSLHEPDEIRSLVRAGGFDEITIASDTGVLRVPPPKQFMWQYIHATPTGRSARRRRRGARGRAGARRPLRVGGSRRGRKPDARGPDDDGGRDEVGAHVFTARSAWDTRKVGWGNASRSAEIRPHSSRQSPGVSRPAAVASHKA